MAKSISVVVPPNAAARVPVSKSSALVVPPNGISRCVCTSMPPGKTYFPMASSTRAAFCLGRFCPTTSILPALIAMSAKYVSVAVTTFPFAMIVSKPICPPFRRSEQEFYAKLPHFGPAFPEKSKGSPMEFGITLKPDISVERIVALTRQAEQAGFGYGWIFDSHVLWKEPYPLLTLMANATRNMRLGPCVTNPAVRDLTVTASLFATLNLISGGRMELGIGRGDSSRRVLGKKPVTPAELERSVATFRELTAGREVQYDGQATHLSWATGSPPVWIAGYGPKVLQLAGRIADGVSLQFADPDLISWCLGFVRKGAGSAGRNPDTIEVMAAAPAWISNDLEEARRQVRWFPAL